VIETFFALLSSAVLPLASLEQPANETAVVARIAVDNIIDKILFFIILTSFQCNNKFLIVMLFLKIQYSTVRNSAC
jgi:hypothetical protein